MYDGNIPVSDESPPELPPLRIELFEAARRLNLPLVEQHRAKVAWQAGVVRRRLRGAELLQSADGLCEVALDHTALTWLASTTRG
jgi:hypothetical protein